MKPEISKMKFSEAETRSQQDFQNASDDQTYIDFKDSLSEDEREKFFDFVREQIKNLPKPVNDLEAWLASKSQAGQNRWEVYYSNFLAQEASKTKVTRNYPSLHDEIEQRRAKIRNNFAKNGN